MVLEDNYRHKGMRKQLIKKLKEKGISDIQVLNAIERVPRHFFLDNAFLEQAYQDKAFPIGEGQTISQPYTVAFQTQLLDIKPGDKVLEIGTGSGYQTCVLLELGAKVYTIEINKVLYQKTSYFLPKIGYHAHFYNGDGSQGLPQYGPFDKIIVTAGAPHLPEKLKKQLNIGGVIVIPVGNEVKQNMIKISKIGIDKFVEQETGVFRFVPLTGKDGWKITG